MKTHLWKITLCALGICSGGLLAGAAPLQRTDVIAAPAWLLHLDCDGLRPTTLGQYILAETDKPDAKAKLAAFQSIFGFDLRTQLHGLTLYGHTAAPEDAVLVVYADFDADRLLVLAKAAKDYQIQPHHQHFISSWIDDKKPAKQDEKPRVYAAIQGPRVIFGQREASVASALDVLDGTAPSLAAGKLFPGLGTPGHAGFIAAAAGKLSLPEGDPNAAIMKLAQSVQLVVGEQQQQCQGTLTLVADSQDVAGHVLAITQGILALTKLQGGNPQAARLASAVTITQDGSNVIGTLTLPSSEVVEIWKADAARKAAAAEAVKSSNP